MKAILDEPFFIRKLVPAVELRSLVPFPTPVRETSRKSSPKLEFRVCPRKCPFWSRCPSSLLFGLIPSSWAPRPNRTFHCISSEAWLLQRASRNIGS